MGVWTISRKRARPTETSAEYLHASAVAASRVPRLYAELGAPDTVEGRFELLTLHVILLVDRLHAEAADGEGPRQALFDTYISQLDGAMREMGVGDLAMGKRMRKLGEAFYGRAASYASAFMRLPDITELEAVLSRTVFEGREVDPAPLAGYVAEARAALAATPFQRLLHGELTWPTP